MHINWRQVSHVVGAMVGTAVPGVAAAEQAAWAIHDVTGEKRRDAVLATMQNAALSVDAIAGREVIKSDEATAATQAVIDAIVHLHNVVAKAVPAAPVAGA